MMTDVPNRITLITGATRGIGRSIAEHMAQLGHPVIGTSTSQAGADKITAYLQNSGCPGQGMVLDVNDAQGVDDMLESIKSTYDYYPSILINNAGIRQDNIILRMKQSQWDEVIETNLSAVYRLTQRCIKPMFKQRWGRIINISSVVASSGNPGQANYVAAKAGILGLTKVVALEFASKGITVNAVAPGFISTDMTETLTDQQKQGILSNIPAGRMGAPQEIAGLVAFLASDVASYITGQNIHVNGGMYLV